MPENSGGRCGRFLDVDLGAGSVVPVELPSAWTERYLGGKALGTRLLLERMPPGLDPLDPDAVLVFSVGPLVGSGAPSANRFNVTTRNVLTGGIVCSNCGGDFGIHLRRAGFSGLLLRGRAPHPVLLEITEEGGRLRDARHLWGLDVDELKAEIPRHVGWVAIGPAGENLVRYASILSGHRVAARGGVGAVMGSKNLKLVQASGAVRQRAADPRAFGRAMKEHVRILKEHALTGSMLPRFGTANMVTGASATGTLPTRNFQAGSFEHARDVSGETLARDHLVRNTGCTGCTIRCARVVRLDGKAVKGPEYETLGMLGPNLGNRNLISIFELNLLADRLGLDTISLGATLAAAMELKERGRFAELPVSFGSVEGLEALVEDIALRRGLGDELAEGSLRLCQRRGAPELAMQSKGLEFAAYEPRGAVGHGLGYAVSNRGGCHLNGGYLVFFEALGPVTMDPLTPKGKPGLVVLQQDLMEAVSVMGGCVFTTYAILPVPPGWLYNPHGASARIVNGALKASRFLLGRRTALPASLLALHLPQIPQTRLIEAMTGRPMRLGGFLELGARANALDRLFNVREGLLGDTDTLPPRMTQTPQRPGRPDTVVPLAEMLPEYYKARGWTPAGVPSEALLRKLGMEEFIPLVRQAAQEPEALRARRRPFLDGPGPAWKAHLEASNALKRELEASRGTLREASLRGLRVERAVAARRSSFVIDGERCQACGLCVKACPVDAIAWKRREKASIDAERCVACGLCQAACPPHFAAVNRRPEGTRERVPYAIIEASCAACGLCARACPVGAITWRKKEKARIDPELCVACGLCFHACPPRFAAIEPGGIAEGGGTP